MKIHKIRKHKQNPICHVCNKPFHPGSINRHKRMQHGINTSELNNRVNCLICNSSQLPKNLASHNTRAHVDISKKERHLLRVGCLKCSKVMAPDELDDHHKVHQAESKKALHTLKWIECKICSRTFLPESLPKHIEWIHD